MMPHHKKQNGGDGSGEEKKESRDVKRVKNIGEKRNRKQEKEKEEEEWKNKKIFVLAYTGNSKNCHQTILRQVSFSFYRLAN